MSLTFIFNRYIVPGLVIQAVIVGAGYATGRELVEFFVSIGPANGLIGMALTALAFTVCAMISFELARQARAFDYQSFCRAFLGRFAILFEIGYVAILLLMLSVVSAAAGKLLADRLGWPETLSSIAFMGVTSFIVFFGNRAVERIISAWAIIFYATYLSLFVLVYLKFGDRMEAAIDFTSIDLPKALWSGLSYIGYNVIAVPILIFVARNFESRKEALIAGALAGPLVLLPGFAFLLVLSAFHPQIVSAPLPVTVVLQQLDVPAFEAMITVVVLGAFIKTGAGQVHGFNERIVRALANQGRRMPAYGRPAIAITAMVIAVFVATSVGLIDLIGKGYRYSSYYFLLIFVLPLVTRGVWLLMRERSHRA